MITVAPIILPSGYHWVTSISDLLNLSNKKYTYKIQHAVKNQYQEKYFLKF